MSPAETTKLRPPARRTARFLLVFGLLLAATILVAPCLIMGAGAVVELWAW